MPQAKLAELNEQLLLLRSRANAQLASDKKQTRDSGSRSANYTTTNFCQRYMILEKKYYLVHGKTVI